MLPRYWAEAHVPGQSSRLLAQFERLNNDLLWKFMLIVGVLVYGSYGVLMHLCEEDGKIPFSSSALVLLIEFTKFCFSTVLFLNTTRHKVWVMPSVQYFIALAIPAILYTINNNVAVHMQLLMDPTTFQVLSNMKTASTAFLYRIIMKRRLTAMKWFALGLLLAAGVCDSYGGYVPSTTQSPDSQSPQAGVALGSKIFVTSAGLQMMIPYCLISGFAGVYTEYMLKAQYHHSIHLQNVILYGFGIVFNLATWTSHARTHSTDYNILRGFSVYTWVLVLTQAMSGLITGVVMKHATNITRLFIISCAMLVATLLSLLVFHTHLTYNFLVSSLMVISAFSVYHYK